MDNINNTQGKTFEAGRGNAVMLVIGWIAAILSLGMYPFIFGVVGVIMGILASKGGSKAGIPLIVASIVLMGIGLIYSNIILTHVRRLLGI